MLITKKVIIKWNRATCTKYKLLGYEFTKIGDEFEVKIEDIPKKSGVKVQCLCDYCLEEGIETIITKTYYNYTNQNEESTIHKDCCKKHVYDKIKESNLLTNGVEWQLQRKEIQEKVKQTNLEKYGCENVFQNKDIKQKIKQTNLEKYGVESYTQTNEYINKTKETNFKRYGTEWSAQNKETREKAKQTCLEKYGVENVFQNEFFREKARKTNIKKFGETYYFKTKQGIKLRNETNIKKYGGVSPACSTTVREKMKKTTIEKYGVEYYSQTDEYKNKYKTTCLEKYGVENVFQTNEVKIKKAETFFKNQSVATSRQQRYLHHLLGGELNYANDTPCLDIAFPDEKIYIEYDGGGHNLPVLHKAMTQKEFDDRERRRNYYLKEREWKCVRIISVNDYIPQDEIILKMIKYAKEYFKTDHSWIYFDIDNNSIINSEGTFDYNYGELRKIKEKDLVQNEKVS